MSNHLLFLLCSLLSITSSAHTLKTQVLSSFVFSRHGDRTPLYTSNASILTPYGAQQMSIAGSNFRRRYLSTIFEDSQDNTVIRDISHYSPNVNEVTVYSIDNQYVTASAQAFMQGLYPPLGQLDVNFTSLGEISRLANGTNVIAPLNGYNYPDINTVSSYDPRSVWIDGAAHCPAYTSRLVEYYNSTDFDFLYTISLDFYRGLDDYLDEYFTPNDLGYFDAYYIYDWLQYEALHNSSFRISDVNMTRAELLAANWVQALFSNSTDSVKSIAGRGLATQVLNTFYNAIRSDGEANKLNLWFGDMAPMVSFAALAGLTGKKNSIFYDIPAMSSSYIFELVALLPEDDTGVTYPNTSDMYVRFLYQNGTDEYSDAVEYSLFGRSPSSLISYTDFVTSMSRISLSGIREWCLTCGAYNVFCPAFTNSNSVINGNTERKGLSPAVAGVIGALVALAVAAILFGLLMAFAGIRVKRQERNRKSELGGFKGSQKLASDQDLTLPKGGAGVTVTTTEPEGSKSHERVGSWELRQQAKQEEAGIVVAPRPRRPSYEDDEIHVDPYAPAVKPHDQV
ncbi:hypothetical protein LTR64_003474 [Lithohypha guttulata]|uniref:uncharacterized protein n=1 Tax=Lithohypha guttulata TaxID=1690604 RepID=UPI002DDE6416|nr:hypothetical protein LTR51_000307 [Lithohypha guttulata]